MRSAKVITDEYGLIVTCYKVNTIDPCRDVSAYLPFIEGMSWISENPDPKKSNFVASSETLLGDYWEFDNVEFISVALPVGIKVAFPLDVKTAFASAWGYARWDSDSSWIRVHLPLALNHRAVLRVEAEPVKCRYCREESFIEELKQCIAQQMGSDKAS